MEFNADMIYSYNVVINLYMAWVKASNKNN